MLRWRSTGRMGGGRALAGPLLATLAVLVVLVSDPAGAQERRGEDPRPPGGVYRRPLGNDPATLEPARVRDIYGLSVAQQIFDGLVRFDQTLTITPSLAQFWRASRDGLTWTFTLRKNVRFHHGREVTADDVVYSLTRLLDPAVKSGAADLFASIRGARDFREGRARDVVGLSALDRHTVQVLVEDASVPFVSLLAAGHAKIVPRDLVEADRDGFGSRPIGTGPFRFVHWERGKEIVLAANPDYFDGPVGLSRVIYRIFPGEPPDAMYEEFQRGNLEDAPLPDRGYRQAVAGGAVYVKRPMQSLRFYGFNTRLPPLNDVRVRQALIHAINREAILEEVFLGRYVAAQGILPPGTQGFNPRLRAPAYDPARARSLLAQAGFPGGRGLPPIVVWSGARHEGVLREHEQIRKYLNAVGVAVEFNYQTDWPTYSRLLAEGRFPVFVYAWYADVPDPDNFLHKLFFSRSPRNFFGYANPAVDGLLQQARGESDLLQRIDRYRRAEQAIMDDAPLLPFMHHTYERLFQPYVRSVEVNGLGDPYIPMRKIWLDRPR